MVSNRVAAALAVTALVGCAAGRPRLPPRIIDDPATLPPKMVWLAGTGQVNAMARPAAVRSWTHWEGAEFRLGLGKRVEVVDILSLRLAVMDDSPTRPEPDALTLAIRAGLGNFEIGDDFYRGAGAIPVLRIDAGKRIATRWRLGAHLAERTYVFQYISDPTVSSAGVAAMYQLNEMVALRSGFEGYRWTATPRAWRPATQAGLGPNLWVGVRPRHWITLAGWTSLVFAWANTALPRAHPERSVADARTIFVEPRYRILIAGAQLILHN